MLNPAISKKFYFILCLFLVYFSGKAQSTNGFSYQAVVRDAEGHIVANKQVSFRISILQGDSIGSTVYTEEFSPTTNSFGLVNLSVGSSSPEEFKLIDWSQSPYFIKVELDPEGGYDYTISGTSQLLSVPYALYAEEAGTQEETDPIFQGWDKSTGIEITISQITDLDQVNTDVQAELNTTQHGAGLTNYGNYSQNQSATYISSAASLNNADFLLDKALKSTADSLAQEIIDRIGAVTSEQTARIEAINAINAKIKSDSTFLETLIETETSERKTDVDTEEEARKVADEAIRSEMNTNNSDLLSAISAETENREKADEDLQNELDASQTGAGLADDGSYSKNSSANYISDATSLNDADVKLDTQVKTNADNLSAEITNRGTAISDEESARSDADDDLQNELDASQTGAGLADDGSYSKNSSANYISDATSLNDADVKLDTQVKTNADNLASEITDRGTVVRDEETARTNADDALQNELDNSQTGAGLTDDGSYSKNTSANYIADATSLNDADVKLDTRVKTNTDNLAAEITNRGTAVSDEETARTNADDALQNELDNSQTGAGLTDDGSYSKNTSANYIADATSLNDADVKLDNQVKTNTDNLAAEITNRGTAVSDEETARTNADDALQNELDNSQTGAGLADDGSYSKNTSANYIADATSLNDADVKLDTQVKTNETAIALNTGKITNATHTGDVTGATELTIGTDKVLDSHINWGTETTQVSTADIPEQTNLYYTEARVSANTNVASNTSKLNTTAGTATANKAVVLDASKNISGLNNVNASKVTGSNIQTNGYFYFGDPDTDGTWRMKPSSEGLLFECRESGSWVEKMTILK